MVLYCLVESPYLKDRLPTSINFVFQHLASKRTEMSTSVTFIFFSARL